MSPLERMLWLLELSFKSCLTEKYSHFFVNSKWNVNLYIYIYAYIYFLSCTLWTKAEVMSILTVSAFEFQWPTLSSHRMRGYRKPSVILIVFRDIQRWLADNSGQMVADQPPTKQSSSAVTGESFMICCLCVVKRKNASKKFTDAEKYESEQIM